MAITLRRYSQGPKVNSKQYDLRFRASYDCLRATAYVYIQRTIIFNFSSHVSLSLFKIYCRRNNSVYEGT